MASPVITPGTLTLEDLLTKGYIPDRVIPPINSKGLAAALPDILAYITPVATGMLKKPNKLRSRCVVHSVPKRKHLRRSLSIPNPLHQTMVALEVSQEWQNLHAFCLQSAVSLSSPVLGTSRTVSAQHDLSEQPIMRAQRSVGARYLLRTDLARFYPSIYTHSIPWALHGKRAARTDKKYALYGNRIDLWTRESQDKQTGGIPIGPDTSFVVAEVIGTALDLEMQKKIPGLRGTRYSDDYYLYFQTVSDAEAGLAALHSVAKQYELEINDPKTEIVALPDSFEPAWKSDLRNLVIRTTGQPQHTDLLSLFDRAYEHARNYPSDSVLTYAAKQVLSADISEENWSFCESLLLRAAIAEPTMLSVLGDIYDRFAAFSTDNQALTSTLESICFYHAPLQQGNEVAWALWIAKKMSVRISEAIGNKVAEVDDDIVAIVGLDLIHEGYMQASNDTLWKSHLTGPSLYEDHWLLAYEAHEQGWLRSRSDYVAADPLFSILQRHGVRFYGDNLTEATSYYSYGENEAAVEVRKFLSSISSANNEANS
jgi:Reverse transcriptase (RNA-dependent DNA polymerase)